MSLSVHPVLDDEGARAFFAAQQRALAELPQWRPAPLRWEQRLFDPQRNPLFNHVDVVRFIAERGGDVVGRVAAWVDARRDDLGFFGFFDTVDEEVGRALAWAVVDWCQARGRKRVRGPIDFWAICSAGTPVSGFDLPNTFALHHGGPHYASSLEAAGFGVVAKIYTWQFGSDPVPPPAHGIARATLADPRLAIVDFDAANDDHWAIVEQLYARCYADGDWFSPMSRGELRVIADGFVEPAVSLLAFVDGAPAAMSIALRNVVESSVRVGSVIPPEPVQRVLRTARSPRAFRQWLFAIDEPYRGRALGHLSTALYVTVRERARAAGLERGEAAWAAAIDNHLSAGLTAVGARRDKTYRLFESTTRRTARG